MSQEVTTLVGVAVTALGILVGAAVQIITGRNNAAIARAEAAARAAERIDQRKDADLARAFADAAASHAEAQELRAELAESGDRISRLQAENLDLTRQLAEELLKNGTVKPVKAPPTKRTRRSP